MKEVILKAGYTLKIVSWENDADFYNTKTYHVEDENWAIILKHICENLLCSRYSSSSDYGVGNTNLSSSDSANRVAEYFKTYGIPEHVPEDELLEWLHDLSYDLVGSSYESDCIRVCESCKVLYTPVDIEVETL
ncbi:hypothetical protein VspSw1_61 [Vibrio phage VspSw_1]|uniref:Uncharacterized protein n=1 Tax=Vibrio phage VspSw_1 TaxID=2484249 RepID=A0A411BKK2_9CAUD|nr:hypothetical protein HOV08_gp061 [Vibrio phage VspSw_1]QAY02134.1 hypothetical protein VspSw1_61 [Vibrio phage VspSw_1]